jgi:hypothetical protein
MLGLLLGVAAQVLVVENTAISHLTSARDVHPSGSISSRLLTVVVDCLRRW